MTHDQIIFAISVVAECRYLATRVTNKSTLGKNLRKVQCGNACYGSVKNRKRYSYYGLDPWA